MKANKNFSAKNLSADLIEPAAFFYSTKKEAFDRFKSEAFREGYFMGGF